MMRWDWRALEECVQQKQTLADRLQEQGVSSADRDQAARIRGLTHHNVQIAATLSQQLSGLLTHNRQPATTYNRVGRVTARPVVMMSFQG